MSARSVKFILLFLAQAALWNYCNFTPYLMIALLPTMLLCLPVERSTIMVMVIAFVTGIAVDFLVTGQLGLTSFALVPGAVFRRRMIRIVFGQELFARGENLSFRRQGWQKVFWAIVLQNALFLLLYIWVDDAGTRTFGYDALKFFLSLVVSSFVGLLVASLMLDESA